MDCTAIGYNGGKTVGLVLCLLNPDMGSKILSY